MSEQAPPNPVQQAGQLMSQLWWVALLRGILLICLGGYALTMPAMTLVALTQVLAIFAIADGVLALIAGISGQVESRGWAIVRGLLGILAGGFVFAHPLIVGVLTAAVLVTLLGIQAVAGGVMEIIVAIRERKQIEGEGWLILSGLLSVVFGAILLVNPFASGVVLIRVLGAYAIFFGVAMIFNAFQLRKLGRRLQGE